MLPTSPFPTTPRPCWRRLAHLLLLLLPFAFARPSGSALAQVGPAPGAATIFLPMAAQSQSRAGFPPPVEVAADQKGIEAGETWMVYGDGVGKVTDSQGNHTGLGDIVYVERSNELWLATGNNLVVWDLTRGSHRTVFQGSTGALLIDADDNIWLGTWDQDLHRISPSGEWQRIELGSRMWCLDQDSAGNIWVCSAGGVSKISPDGTIAPPLLGDAQFMPVWDIAAAPDGAVWVVSGGNSGYGYLHRIDPDGLTTLDWSARGSAMGLAVDLDGTVWHGHWGRGLEKRNRDGSRQLISASEGGLPGNYVFEIAIAPDGTRWFGTNAGVGRLDPDGRWRAYGTQHGLPGAEVRAITFGPTGEVWLGTSQGLAQIPADQLGLEPALAEIVVWPAAPAAVPERSSSAVAIGPDGARWFGLHHLGAARLDSAGRWTVFTPESTGGVMPPGTVHHIVRHPNGSMWFAADGGVARMDLDGSWKSYTVANGLVPDEAWRLAVDHSGRVWATGRGGYSLLEGDGTLLPRRRDTLYMWYADGSVGVDSSLALDGQALKHRFTLPPDRAARDLVDVSMNTGNRVHAWYKDGTRSEGTSATLGIFDHSIYRLPAGRSYADIVAVGRDGNDVARAYYRDGTVSGGNGANFTAEPPVPFRLPADKRAEDVVDVAFTSDGRTQTWYRDGTVSVGNTLDLAAYAPPRPFRFAPGKSAADVVGAAFLRPGNVRGVAVDGAGNTWLLHDPDRRGNWLYRILPDEEVSEADVADGATNMLGSTLQAFTAPDGKVWIAGRGFWVFAPSGEIVEFIQGATDLTPGSVWHETRQLTWDSEGTAWVQSSLGLHHRKRNGMWEYFPRHERGLVGYWLDSWGLAFDNIGDLWLSSTDGIFRLRREGVGDSCESALAIDDAEGLSSAIEVADDVDVFRFEVDQPGTVEVSVFDPEGRLEVLRTCEEAVGTAIGASSGSGRHIGPGERSGYEQRHQYEVGTQTGSQFIAVRARPGMFKGAAIDYFLRATVTAGAPVSQTRTLILTDKPRLQGRYNATTEVWAEWEAALDRLSKHPKVAGQLITDMADDSQVDPAVVEAYRNWRTAPIAESAAEARELANAVRAWLLRLKHGDEGRPPAMPHLAYVVIAGDDSVIPWMRVPIWPPAGESYGWEREVTYLSDPSPIHLQSRLGSSLADDYALSDDVYAMSSKVPWGELRASPRGPVQQILDLPQLSVGRLVESPEDMIHQIDTFIARDGVLALDLTTAMGYHFMADGPELGDDYLRRYSGIADDRRTRIIGDEHTLARWQDAILRRPFDLLFFAAHASHYLFQTPDNGVFRAEDILSAPGEQDFAGRLVYGLACHAGLNVPVDGFEHAQAVDFPEAWSRRGATYVGATGWAYGFDGAVQYQEDLMAEFTRWLVEDGGRSVGEALTLAKRNYYWDMGQLNHFHAKTIAGTVLYGLPMYRVATPKVPPDFGERDLVTWEGDGSLEELAPGLARRRQSLQVKAGAFERKLAADGQHEYFELVGRRPRPEAGQPAQPHLRWQQFGESLPVEGGYQSLALRSVVWLGGGYTDHANFRPWVLGAGRMGQLKQTTRVQSFTAPSWYPSLPLRLRSLPVEVSNLRRGTEAWVVATMGQFDSANATERLFDSTDVALYYSASADENPPAIDSVQVGSAGEQIEIAVEADDASGILAVYVTWTTGSETDGTGRWQSEYIAEPTGGAWRTTLPRDAIALVQVVDRAGNVEVADDEGAFYRLTTTR